MFVHTDTGDNTLEIIGNYAWDAHIEDVPEAFIPREKRLGDDRGATAYRLLADLRNRVLGGALLMDADIILSLDTDIFLTNPTAIEQLVDATHYAPVASPYVDLHPFAGMAPNAANWKTTDVGSPTRIWERCPTPDYGEHILVDAPMAAVLMRRWVAEDCAYHYHESGEDLGFAQDLDRNDYRALWLTGLKCPHVMDRSKLNEMVPL